MIIASQGFFILLRESHNATFVRTWLMYVEVSRGVLIWQDMVAFSRCVYEGDHEEKVRLDNAREQGWRGKFNRTGRVQQTPEEIRRDGKCPLTPVEVCFLNELVICYFTYLISKLP